MAGENKASYAAVGLSVLLGLGAVATVLIRFGGLGGREGEVLVETYYDRPVTGLSVGSAVNYRGVKVGEVRAIDFAYCVYDTTERIDRRRVVIVMALDGKRLGMKTAADRAEAAERVREAVEDGVRATVSSSGITGLSKIELGVPSLAQPTAKLTWRPRHPLIPPQPSLLDSFSDAATRVVNALDGMDFQEAWSNVNATAASAARVADKVDAFVESQRAGLAAIVQNVEQASASVRDLAESLKADPSRLIRASDPAPLAETTSDK